MSHESKKMPDIPGYERDGVLGENDLKPVLPPAARVEKGPVAIIECVQNIPCNPCLHACPFGAISMEKITDTPSLDGELCTGCGKCVARCPGLAIFIVDMNYSEDEGTVSLPYEFLPVPNKGEIWNGLNRNGEVVCDARVLRVLVGEKQDGTAVVTVAVPKRFAMEVRNIKFKGEVANRNAIREKTTSKVEVVK